VVVMLMLMPMFVTRVPHVLISVILVLMAMFSRVGDQIIIVEPLKVQDAVQTLTKKPHAWKGSIRLACFVKKKYIFEI
jgi:hypothetical protein